MKRTSLTAVAVQPGVTELRKLPLPEIGDDDGLMAIEAVAVCATDVAIYEGKRQNIPFPLVLGHECVGRVAKVGPKAAKRWGVKEGDRIVIEEPYPCGQCWVCRTVNYQLCPHGGRYGQTPITTAPSLWGAFSEYLYLHPNAMIYPVSEHVPAEELTMFVPIANGIYWLQQVGGLGIGETVVIEGPGHHGLGCVIAAREAGAGCVIVTGLSRDARRLELARELGAHHTIDVEREDAVARVREITGGRMADMVVDITAGAPAALSMAVDLARIGGTVILAGTKHKPVELNADQIFRKEITLRGVYGRQYQAVLPALRLIESGRYPLSRLLSHVFPLAETERAMLVHSGRAAAEREPLHICITTEGGRSDGN